MKTVYRTIGQAIRMAAFLAAGAAMAGPGHDHGDTAAAPTANGPQRQPNGTVFLPKPSQRQMAIRTLPAKAEALARSVELQGRVVMDPNAGGRVQSTVAGRIEAGPAGLPSPGDVVRKGQVLAWVLPSTGAIERSNQGAQLAEWAAAERLADQRLARLRQLADTVPRKDIEAAEAELASLRGRSASVRGGLASREALVAPVGGVISSAAVVAGQVVDARELIYEIVDPQRLRVEALAYDAAMPANIAGATLAIAGASVPLRFAGSGRSLRDQALPLQFRTAGPTLATLAIGQPVTLQVQLKSTVQGHAVPTGAVVRNPSNQQTVWVKTDAERFAPRVVTLAPLDGARSAATAGLQDGDRVVVQGAGLLNQIR